jgi:putative transcriptional regulator
VIRFRLNELLADKSFKEGRRIEWQEVAEQSGIHRTTLSRMLNVRGYNASMSNVDSLCRYFGCQVGDLAIYVPDEELATPVTKSYRGKPPASGRQPR